MDEDFNAALARLDAEIREAEARLADLRLKRAGAEAFLEYMASTGTAVRVAGAPKDESAPAAPRVSVSDGDHDGARVAPSDAVMEVFKRFPGEVLDIDQIFFEVLRSGAGLDRTQVRNGIHYAARKGWIDKAGRRGMWRLPSENASAPVAPGAEVTEESASDSSREMGGTDNGSALLRGGDESAISAQALHDHAGVRASIGGSDPA